MTIERQDGAPVGIDDCERVSRLLSPLLDETDPIPESYYLEVSSAGTERELRRPEHFPPFFGKKVAVRLYAPHDGKKQAEGILRGYENGAVTLETDGGTVVFPKDAVAKVTAPDDETSFC